jgi:hypothetical protein
VTPGLIQKTAQYLSIMMATGLKLEHQSLVEQQALQELLAQQALQAQLAQQVQRVLPLQ